MRVGRPVTFYNAHGEAQPAQVSKVHSETCVDLITWDADGEAKAVISVTVCHAVQTGGDEHKHNMCFEAF